MRDRLRDALAFAAALVLALPLLAGCVAPVAYYPEPAPVVVYPAPVVVFPYFWVGPGYYGGRYYREHPGHYGRPGYRGHR